MGTGKSSVAPLLGKELGLPVVDLDEELARCFGPIEEQFRSVGEHGFRERESNLLASLCDGKARVLATGGGAWVSERNQALLTEHFWRVVLQAPIEVLAARITQQSGRPLWDANVEERLRARASAYRRADFIVDTSDHSVNEVATEILQWLRSR